MPRKQSDFVEVYDRRTGKKRPMKVLRSRAEANPHLSLTPLAKQAAAKKAAKNPAPKSRRLVAATNPPPETPDPGAAPTSGDDESQKE